jgi:hypothetical protein
MLGKSFLTEWLRLADGPGTRGGRPRNRSVERRRTGAKIPAQFLDTIKKMHCKKKVSGFPVQLPSRDVTYQTLPGREYLIFNYSRPGEFGEWHPGWGGENREPFLQCGTLVAGDTYILVFIINGANFANFFWQTPMMQKWKKSKFLTVCLAQWPGFDCAFCW